MFTASEVDRLLRLKNRLSTKYQGYYEDRKDSEEIRKPRKSVYTLKAAYEIQINGETFTTDSLKRFSDETGLSCGALRRACYNGSSPLGYIVKKL